VEKEEERTWTIGPQSKLTVYRLRYVDDAGMTISTDIFSTSPMTEVFVDMKFGCTPHILGLNDILLLFSHTFPESENKVEWENIRNSIVANTDKSETERFKLFVSNLSTITPGSSNKVEWAAIRNTCHEILNSWDNTDKQPLFQKLLTRFSVTKPESSNKVEWAKIRELSDKILAGLTKLF